MKPLSYGSPAGLLRRLAALFYDFLLLVALLMMGVGVIVAILEALHSASLVSYGTYQDVSDLLSNHPLWSPIFTLYLLGIWSGFFIGFWKKGQTLGMRAWQIRIQNTDGTNINTKQAMIRFITSLFGLGNLFVIMTRPKRSLQDICAKCLVVLAPVK